MEEKREFHWIDDNVVIDFPVPRAVQQLMDACERFDLEESMLYQDYADTLDSIVKEMYVNGRMTREQWKRFEDRYLCMG